MNIEEMIQQNEDEQNQLLKDAEVIDDDGFYTVDTNDGLDELGDFNE